MPVHEALITANRERVRSAEARPLLMIRRQRGEAPFGYFKQFGGLRRFMGRGLAYAQKKTLLAAAGFNLLKLLRHQAALAAILRLCKLTSALRKAGIRAGTPPPARCARTRTFRSPKTGSPAANAWRRPVPGLVRFQYPLSGGC